MQQMHDIRHRVVNRASLGNLQICLSNGDSERFFYTGG